MNHGVGKFWILLWILRLLNFTGTCGEFQLFPWIFALEIGMLLTFPVPLSKFLQFGHILSFNKGGN